MQHFVLLLCLQILQVPLFSIHSLFSTIVLSCFQEDTPYFVTKRKGPANASENLFLASIFYRCVPLAVYYVIF